MKILVVSDTHKNTECLELILKKLIGSISFVLHLGDCYQDIEHLCLKYPDLYFESVRGNCDCGDKASENILEIMCKKIFLTHGHNYGVKHGYMRIAYAAMERNADICLFGHTHVPAIFEINDIVFMNPGSISFPRGNANNISYGILEITEAGNVFPSIVEKQGDIFRPI